MPIAKCVRLVRNHDRGSMSVEAVLLAPILVLLVLFVVHVGRLGAAQVRLVTVADHAARAASLVHPRAMHATARSTALDNLMQNGLTCESISVQVQITRQSDPGVVRVAVECLLDRSSLDMLAPVPRTLQAVSSEVIDRWRVDS